MYHTNGYRPIVYNMSNVAFICPQGSSVTLFSYRLHPLVLHCSTALYVHILFLYSIIVSWRSRDRLEFLSLYFFVIFNLNFSRFFFTFEIQFAYVYYTQWFYFYFLGCLQKLSHCTHVSVSVVGDVPKKTFVDEKQSSL